MGLAIHKTLALVGQIAIGLSPRLPARGSARLAQTQAHKLDVPGRDAVGRTPIAAAPA